MLERLVTAAVLLAATAPVPARFAPIPNRAYRYVTTETRTDGATRYRFTVERRVLFQPDGGGWTATVTIAHTAAEAPPAMARAFEAGQSAVAAHPVRYHLDANGAVIRIEDEDTLWANLIGAFASGGRPVPRPDSTRRHAVLASTLEVLIAGTDAGRLPGPPRPVRIAARPLAGAATELSGSEEVSRTATGDLFLLAHAASDKATGNHLSLTLSRRIDPKSGLVVEQDRVTDSTQDGVVARVETYWQLSSVS